MIYIGVDPGASGAIVVLNRGLELRGLIRNSETEADIAAFVRSQAHDVYKPFAYIERVHSMPKQGVASSFKFGQSYGFLRGLLIACGIPFEEISPVKWQTEMKCRSGGDKNVTKARAQQLFPDVKVTHANADALLLAEYCRRTRTNVA